jgi:chromosome segregation ATPase
LLFFAAARAVSPAAVPVKHLPKPRTLPEALQQLAVLKQSIAALQQQLLDQDQQASQRAQLAKQAFERQLSTEKVQLQSERKNSTLLMQTIEQLRERLAQEQAHCAQLQRQLDDAQDELQEARAAGGAGSSNADYISQLQWRLQEKQTSLISLQDFVQELLSKLKAAGRLVGPAASAVQKAGAMKQLDAAVQQLLADVTSQAALLEQQHQQRQGQQVQEDAAALQRQLEAQQQLAAQLWHQVAELQSSKEEYEAAIQLAHDNQLACEQQLLTLHDIKTAKQGLERQVRQQQQKLQQQSLSLESARGELDRALEDRAALAAHLEECREQLADLNQQLAQRAQQLANVSAERDVLIDRIREFADRQSSCSSSAAELCSSSSGRAGRFGSSSRGIALHDSSSSSPNGMSAEAQQLLSDACAELNQRVAVLEKQLDESHAKEDRLQLANAQLQERLSAMQVSLCSM